MIWKREPPLKNICLRGVTQFEEHFAASLAGQFVTVESGVGLYGDQRRIEFRYVPVITPQGDTLGVCLMIEDVSARHESIRQAAELTLEKERLRILSEFVTGVSHEFRTPLSIINSSVYLLRRSTDAQRQQDRLSQIEQQSGAILSLVDAMVTMVDLERITLVRVPLDLPQLAELACTTAAGRYSSKSIGIELQIRTRCRSFMAILCVADDGADEYSGQCAALQSLTAGSLGGCRFAR